MAERAPHQMVMEQELPGLATDVDDDYVLGEVEEAGSIYDASYTPTANITGAATNNRKLEIINKGQDGNGAVVLATLDFNSGAVTALDYDEKPMVLTSTLADRNVVAGDIISVHDTAPGTGIADPGGHVKVVFQRTAS